MAERGLLDLFAIPPHAMGAPFVPENQEQEDALLLAHAAIFAAAYGHGPFDLGPAVGDAAYRRWKRELDAQIASTDRYLADLARRRATYGYGLLGRVREWWGER